MPLLGQRSQITLPLHPFLVGSPWSRSVTCSSLLVEVLSQEVALGPPRNKNFDFGYQGKPS